MTHDPTITCCFTGHRALPIDGRRPILDRLLSHIKALYEQGYRRFIAGGALGFDTYAAAAVLMLKETLPGLELILMIPCRDQSDAWRESERALYEQHKALADEVIVLTEHYYDGCMRERNLRMVEESSACIAYLTRPRSGAAQTARFAREKGIPVLNCAEG